MINKEGQPNIDLRIYKYPLKFTDLQEVAMPKAARILSVAIQDEAPRRDEAEFQKWSPRRHQVICLWALCDINQELDSRQIEIIGMGNPVSLNSREFIGTVIDGYFVWHVFERT